MSLQDAGALVTIVTALLALWFGYIRIKKNAIEMQLRFLEDEWTNEGAVDGSVPPPFIFINLKVEKGEVSGCMRTQDGDYWVNVEPGWPNAKVYGEPNINGLPFDRIQASIRLSGRNNRIIWRLKIGGENSSIPRNTLLWPVPAGARG